MTKQYRAHPHRTAEDTRPAVYGHSRIARAALAAMTAAGLCATGTAVAQAASATTPTCSVSALTASFGRGLAGGMNHQGVVLKLKNTSARTCLLRGYPGLGLENAAHRTLHSTTHWGDTWYARSPAKSTLTLRQGQSAEAVISWTHADSGTPDAVHAAYLQVTPPAATSHKTLEFPHWVDHGDLRVTALARRIPVND